MKKFFSVVIIIATTMFICGISNRGETATNTQPTCVLIKFVNDTRFKNLDSDSVLSDLVVEKLLNSGKIRLMETKPIEKNTEKLLYDNQGQALKEIQLAMNQGDFNALFEGTSFNYAKAGSVADGKTGQIVNSVATSRIGKENNAQYLIQGTIMNMGRGSWLNMKVEGTKAVIGLFGIFGGIAGQASQAANMFNEKETGVGVQTDLRVIKADTGEIVWHKIVTSVDASKKTYVGLVGVGDDTLSMNQYNKAMDKAAQEIVKALVKDIESGKLFKNE